ncbi:MAG TPA: LysE family transporter [Actinomycetes bacterium]|nr:LysE family transporter [Actinomycetes bacterium]
MHTSFLIGIGLGAVVAAQPGPIMLLMIRSVLRGALAVGLAMALAVALIDTLYAGLGVAGTAPLLTIGPLEIVLGLVGAAVLIGIGARTLWSAFRVRSGAESADEVASPRRAFLTTLAATASNPLTIASWAAIFAAASSAGAAAGAAATLALLGGVGIGSLVCMSVLATLVNLGRRRVGRRTLTGVDVVAGTGIAGFGAALAVAAVVPVVAD